MKTYCYLGLSTTYILYFSSFHFISYKILKNHQYPFELFISNLKNSFILSLITIPLLGFTVHKLIK
jgi:hypothetical protein